MPNIEVHGHKKVKVAHTIRFNALETFVIIALYKSTFTIPYSITERRVSELISVLGSQPAGDVSHKPSGRLPLLSARPACSYPRNPREGCCQFCCLANRGTIGVNGLPRTVTRQLRDCDLNPGPSVPESSTLIVYRATLICSWTYLSDIRRYMPHGPHAAARGTRIVSTQRTVEVYIG